MAANRNWYPTGRQNQINFTRKWMSVFIEPALDSGGGSTDKKKWQAWGIPEETFAAFGETYSAAAAALEAVILSGLRQGPLHAAVAKTFAALEKLARDIKRRYLFSPPLSAKDLNDLAIKERDTVRTSAPVPRHTPAIGASNPEKHTIRLAITRSAAADQNLSSFRIIIRAGILSRDGKIPEKTPNAAWYIPKVPVIPEDLPKQFNGNRKIETFILSALESGSTAYFSAAFENTKGEAGPWGEIIPVIIT